jgi:hypothetical protein
MQYAEWQSIVKIIIPSYHIGCREQRWVHPRDRSALLKKDLGAGIPDLRAIIVPDAE